MTVRLVLKRTAIVAAMCVSCTHVVAAPRVWIAPQPAVAARAEPAPRAPIASTAPFTFVAGRPIDALHTYATQYWGPNGDAVFTSAASVRRTNDLTLVSVGRYAVVEIPELDGFFVRDFGEAGWVNEFEGSHARVVVKYTIRDDDRGNADWKEWQRSNASLPQITSVAHMIVEIWSFAAPKRPRVELAHEYEAWANCCGSEIGPAPPRVSDDVEVEPNEVHLRVRDAWRATKATWHETPVPGIDPVLAPWDGPKEITIPY